MKNFEQEEAAIAAYNLECQKAHENVTDETYKISRKTFKWVKYIGIIVITWFCSVEYDRYFGSFINGGLSRQQVELENYILSNDKVSAEHVWQIVDEQKLLIDDLRRKINWKTETHIAMMGFLTNDKDRLELATTINPDRKNGFPFKDWHPHITKNILEFSINAFHIEALEWVVEQPEWYTIVSVDLVDRINLLLKEYSVKDE